MRAHKLAMLMLVGFYLVVLFDVIKLSRSVAPGTAPAVSAESVHVLNRPHSVALLLTLIGTGRFISSAPIGIAFLFYLLYLIPVFRILAPRSEEHTSELQSLRHLVCRH